MKLLALLEQRKTEKLLRKKLVECFGVAGLYYLYESEKFKRKIYPKIHSARNLEGRIEYVFTLLNGMDPKETKKKEYVFYQIFGRTLKIETDGIKKYILTIYAESLAKEIKWNWDVISPNLRGTKLPIYCGKDVNNEHVAYDMVKNPHLLIAGETGSGKSTQVRSVLTTLIKRTMSNDLHLYLADLKRSEFHLFRRVEHVKAVCTKVSELKRVLAYLKKETELRGDLLDKYEVMHVDDLPEHERVPYIVLCIDEVALLKDEKDVMAVVEDISAIGRALGMFLILSMQRPDAKVLDGKLKINLTVRMGFRCADLTNSRIVGTPGAEKIESSQGGRFLLKLERLTEVQAPYLDDVNAKKELEPYKIVPIWHEVSVDKNLTPEKTEDDSVEQDCAPENEPTAPQLGLLDEEEDNHA
ncbi:FtsK/SpoIIIE domain-containing protein [Halalkalibacter urbisdiaboli]|uniref:FtsK/SpoIIIE domain-containing protein n=1 Tax=Halalkalibacter urbisdiaboli TaxID=1960589 RepID=UPI000B43C414|nr:FtsK/SpoIIIE domain-containing protein [Halalkalibacter urbisdiaboli]